MFRILPEAELEKILKAKTKKVRSDQKTLNPNQLFAL